MSIYIQSNNIQVRSLTIRRYRDVIIIIIILIYFPSSNQLFLLFLSGLRFFFLLIFTRWRKFQQFLIFFFPYFLQVTKKFQGSLKIQAFP